MNVNEDCYRWNKDSLKIEEDGRTRFSFERHEGIPCVRKTQKSSGISFLYGRSFDGTKEIYQAHGGSLYLTEFSPILKNNVRKVTKIDYEKDERELVRQCWYDENGEFKKVYEKTANGAVIFEKKIDEETLRFADSGSLIWKKSFDQKGD